tara:strand:+ start:151 stop:384 length:234 start_codon:yes stop_codon:yes gene_type:complete
MTGTFYNITWDLNDFCPEEIGLPTLVFESKSKIPFSKDIFNPNKVFVFERNSYPENHLISSVLEDTYRTTVSKINPV